ncbi:alpha/beta fold hydrolase [Angustibacter peucedani]
MPVLPGAEPFSHDGGDTGVLVCHGFTGSPQSLRPLAQRLADDGLSVRLPRLPGHGTTWQEMNRTRWADWYAEVERAFAELVERCDRVFVAGLSMGGALALRVAELQPARVAGVVVVNPCVTLGDPRLAALPVLKHLVPSLGGIASDIALPDAVELAYDRTPLKALHSFVQAWPDVVRDLPLVTQPLLLMRSAQDHVVPAKSSALVLSRVSSKDVTELVLEKSYHVATLDHDAPLVEDQTLAFVRRVTG